MSSLNYLTVQDILWIHFQITRKVASYQYARLEESTFYQYAYGESRTLESQAGRFLSGFAKLKPFDTGNDAVALIATAAFLSLNGRELEVAPESAAGWYKSASAKVSDAIEAISRDSAIQGHDHEAHRPAVRVAIRAALAKYADAATSLSEASVAGA